jgi:uncharacterized membrane protein
MGAYLEELRSHLTGLDPKRIDEIISEARSHLECCAAQLRAGGMSEEEANAEAVRTFGDPRRMAGDLRQGNEHHRRPLAIRAFGAVAIAFGSVIAVSALVSSAAYAKLFVASVVTPLTGLDVASTTPIVSYAAYCWIALLTGIVGGRRFWWVSPLPLLVFTGAFLLTRLASPWSSAGVNWSAFALSTLVRCAVFTAIMGGLSWLGSRLPARRRLSTAITVVCVSVVAAIWVGGFVVPGVTPGRTGVEIWHLGLLVAAAVPVMLAFVVACHRDCFLSRQAFIAAVRNVCGIGLLAVIALALAFYGEGRSTLGKAQPAFTIAGLACVAGLVYVAGLVHSLAHTVWTRSAGGASPSPEDSSE